VESGRKSSLIIVDESIHNSFVKIQNSAEKPPTDSDLFDVLYNAIENSDQEVNRGEDQFQATEQNSNVDFKKLWTSAIEFRANKVEDLDERPDS